MRINVINPSQDSRWDEFVENHALGCVFHHSRWKEVIEETFPQTKPCYLIAEGANGAVRGCIPIFLVKSWITGSRLVSLPFSLHCDPLVDSQDVFESLAEAVLRKQRESGSSFTEVRTRFAGNLFGKTDFIRFQGYKNHTLSLEPEIEALRKSFHRTCVRQRINRAEQSNLTVKEACSEADMRTFYELHCMTRKKFGMPPQPYRFYQNMWKILHPQKMLGVLIAKYGSQPVSSLLMLKYKQRIHAEYMGTDDKFLQHSPNILLFWKAIQKSKAEGYQFFDFGGSHASNIALINFKRRWGTVEEDIPHYNFPDTKGFSAELENSTKYRLLTTIGRKMPDWLFRWAGNCLYRHLGG